MIFVLKDMFRVYMIDFSRSWEDHPYLVEFSNNNSYQASIKMVPFVALYGEKY